MADQKRWFKLWHTILDDDDILSLLPADRWAFAALGCYLVVHGRSGRIVISPRNAALAVAFGCQPETVLSTLKRLPHVLVEEGQNDNGKIIVIMKNWSKYQKDSTSYKRLKRWRDNDDKRRGEERRREEKRKDIPPLVPQGTLEGFETFWTAYPRHESKSDAEKAWKQHRPPLARILSALAWQTHSEKWRQGIIPHAASYLRKKRWEDEPPKPSTDARRINAAWEGREVGEVKLR